MTALKTFANPSIDMIKAVPEGTIELALRGAAVVSKFIATQNHQSAHETLACTCVMKGTRSVVNKFRY